MFIFVVLLLSFTFPCHGAVWTPEDMMNVKIIKDVRISPDNQFALFVATESHIQEGNSRYISRIYKKSINSQDAPQLLIMADYSCFQPRWSPDGQSIAFLSNKTFKKLCICDKNGHLLITYDTPQFEIQTFSWSPNNRYIAFVMKDSLEKDSPHFVNRLWIMDVDNPNSPQQPLTPKTYNVKGTFNGVPFISEEFDWSPDSKELTFASSSFSEKPYLESHLATANLDTGEIKNLPQEAQYECIPRYSPDGKWIAYQSSEKRYSFAHYNHISIISLDDHCIKHLRPTENEGGTVSRNLIGWTADSQHVLFFEPNKTRTHLLKLPINGSPAQEVIIGNGNYQEVSLGYDHEGIGYTEQLCNCPPEAFVNKIHAFNPIQISYLNQSFLSYPKTTTEIITWKAEDGREIEGLLTYPINYQKGEKYPLLLIIHGGPMMVFDEVFAGLPGVYPIAAFAQKGFLILRPNPRGSTGYGKTFRKLNYGDWAGKDYEDIIAGVDSLIEQGLADQDALGIMGWSYGGYLAAWAVTQTNRFKAASIGAPITNLISFTSTTDIPQFPIEYLGEFWRNPKIYFERSPVFFASNIRAPCLIQHGQKDVRVPVSQSYEFYHTLKLEGKEVTLDLYPDTGHRIHNPEYLLDIMNKNLAWFTEKMKLE